jgi:hypothetical protein
MARKRRRDAVRVGSPAGRLLKTPSNRRRREMTAAVHKVTCARGTKPGLQVDSEALLFFIGLDLWI